MIVVAMTSWVKRIENVRQVVESIMNNTVKPDRVYLNLSESEFEGINLPEDLVEYFNSDERLIINWVSGENTKCMKKIFPILKYLDEDDIIIDADDDILFPEDLIESRISDFRNWGMRCCVTSNLHRSIGFDHRMKVVSAVSLFQKKMLHNWEKLFKESVIKTYNDDRTYLYLLWLNGYRNVSCSKWDVKELVKNFSVGNENALSKRGCVKTGRRFDEIMKTEFTKMTRRDILKSFGLWRV